MRNAREMERALTAFATRNLLDGTPDVATLDAEHQAFIENRRHELARINFSRGIVPCPRDEIDDY